MRLLELRRRVRKAGLPPGTATYTGDAKAITPTITVVQYDREKINEKTGTDLDACLSELPSSGVTWLNVDGLNNVPLIEKIAKRFGLHPLTVEDILNVEQRPKLEEFDGYLFVTLKTLYWKKENKTFSMKQISLILGKDFVLSFQEKPTPDFELIRTRLRASSQQRLREQGSDYLLYRLMDSIVDGYFVVLETLGDHIEKTENIIISDPTPKNSRTIYHLKQEMLIIRKMVWPLREVFSHIAHSETDLITNFTRVYLRDVYDHVVQAIDIVETFRDILSSLLDMYLSSLTNRMNEIMKTLTIITTIFIPITAIASIYGMNFEKLPGLQNPFGFGLALGAMGLIAVGMLIYFKVKKWI